MANAIVQTLIDALGDARVSVDEATLRERRHDYWVLSQLDDLQDRAAPQPACVVQPTNTQEVVAVVNACRESGTPLIPFGLGSGVCGGVVATAESVLLDMSEMNRTVSIDMDNLLATFEAGVRGSDAEAAVAKRGLTIGHWPQSIDVSTVGGWVSTRAAGQFSSRYGSIEDMLMGLEVVLPNGEVMETRLTPRASAGPDLRQIFLGAEGTMGVVTSVTFSLRYAAERQAYSAYFAPDMDAGLDLLRAVMQARWAPPVMRLYDSSEVHRVFPDHAKGDDALVLFVHEGPAAAVDAEKAGCAALAQDLGCTSGPEAAVEQWLKERNHVPTFESFLKNGIILDTIEIAAPWDKISGIYHNVVQSLGEVENILNASAHASHCYRSGVNLYFTFAARPDDSADMADVYRECWRRTLEATVVGGGGIAHHHGIGRLRRDWMPRELGDAGTHVLQAIKQALDPTGFMNPGVLIPHA